MVVKLNLKGTDKVIEEFTKIAVNPIPQREFIETVSRSFLSLLRDNTPVDTGELQRSWREISKTDTTLQIGTTDDQIVKLRSLVFGTRYTQPNDFISPIVTFMMDNLSFIFLPLWKKSSRYIQGGGGGMRTPPTTTASNITGLTGTRFVKRRGLGRSYLGVIRTGRKRYTRRLSFGVRRRVGV